MKALVQKFGYVLDPVNKIWIKPTYEGIAYSDGDKVETRIASVIQQASPTLHRLAIALPFERHARQYPASFRERAQRRCLGDRCRLRRYHALPWRMWRKCFSA